MEQPQTEVQEQTANALASSMIPPATVRTFRPAGGSDCFPASLLDLRNGAGRQR